MPPLLCVFCGARTTAKEPCAKCGRPPVAGAWIRLERSRWARARSIVILVLLLGPWLMPVAWAIGGVLVLLAGIGAPLPQAAQLAAQGSPVVLVLVGLLLPLLAIGLAFFLRELTAEVLADVLDTHWRFDTTARDVALRATTRGDRLRGAEGEITIVEDEPVSGAPRLAELGSAEVDAIAKALAMDRRDVRVLATVAGMVARKVIVVHATRTLRWIHGGRLAESTDFAVTRGVVEPAAGSPEANAVGEVAAEEALPIHDVWRRIYEAQPEAHGREPRATETESTLATILQRWMEAEPALAQSLVDRGTAARDA